MIHFGQFCKKGWDIKDALSHKEGCIIEVQISRKDPIRNLLLLQRGEQVQATSWALPSF
jgi:hypothetical protein